MTALCINAKSGVRRTMNHIIFNARAVLTAKGIAALQAQGKNNEALLAEFFASKTRREAARKNEYLVKVELTLPYQKRTFKQNAAIWKLIEVLFESQEGRKPCEEEKEALYADALEAFADRVPNKLTGQTRPVHISEANSLQAGHFIEALLQYLAETCGLQSDLQADVRGVLWQWEQWKGGLSQDDSDYLNGRLRTMDEWRDNHRVSQASGIAGLKGELHLHHIIHKGARPDIKDKAWVWVMLTPEEHAALHQYGEEQFLAEYPHLRGRFERAKRLASGRDKSVEELAQEVLG
jgi:hypothetical protein